MTMARRTRKSNSWDNNAGTGARLKPPKVKQKWENPLAAQYMDPNMPGGWASTIPWGGGAKTLGEINADRLMNPQLGQEIMNRLFSSMGPGATVSGSGFMGPTPEAKAAEYRARAAGPAVPTVPTGMYSLPNVFVPSDAQAQGMLNLISGAGGQAQSPQANPVAAMLAALAAAYQRHLATMNSAFGNAESTGTTAADAALAAVRANPSPYGNIQLQHGQDMTNPLAAYMQALGTSSTQADATMGLLNAQNQTANAGLDQLAANLGTINQNAQNGTLNDIERSKQAFIQQLAQQKAAEELALKNYYASRGVKV